MKHVQDGSASSPSASAPAGCNHSGAAHAAARPQTRSEAARGKRLASIVHQLSPLKMIPLLLPETCFRIVYFGISRETLMIGGGGETRPGESPQRQLLDIVIRLHKLPRLPSWDGIWDFTFRFMDENPPEQIVMVTSTNQGMALRIGALQHDREDAECSRMRGASASSGVPTQVDPFTASAGVGATAQRLSWVRYSDSVSQRLPFHCTFTLYDCGEFRLERREQKDATTNSPFLFRLSVRAELTQYKPTLPDMLDLFD